MKKIDKFTWYMIVPAVLFFITWIVTGINCNLVVTFTFVVVIMVYTSMKKKNEKNINDHHHSPKMEK